MIAFDKSKRVRVVLESAPSAVFICRYLTARESMKVEALMEEKPGDPGDRMAYLGQLVEAAALGLVGWEGVTDEHGAAVAFEPGRLPDLLSLRELQELVWKKLAEVTLSEGDQKKSESPSASGTG